MSEKIAQLWEDISLPEKVCIVGIALSSIVINTVGFVTMLYIAGVIGP